MNEKKNLCRISVLYFFNVSYSQNKFCASLLPIKHPSIFTLSVKIYSYTLGTRSKLKDLPPLFNTTVNGALCPHRLFLS